jgi:hypothetical protein
LQSLSLRGNQIELRHLTTFIAACKENKRVGLRSIDFSCNNLCDKAGVLLARCFREMKSLERVNLKNNCLDQESGDAFLYLVKENPKIVKCKLELNMVKYN